MQLRLPLAHFALVGLVLSATCVAAQQVSGEAQPPAAPAPPQVQAPVAPAPAPPVAPAPAPAPPVAQPGAPPLAEQGTPAIVLSQDESEGIIGKSVRSAAGEDMGRIVDIIVTATNQPRAAVIDFGGFLGVGSRKIAVDWRLLQYSRTGKTWGVTFALTRNQVRVSPEYKPGEPVVVLSMPVAAPAAAAPAAPPAGAPQGPAAPVATAPATPPAGNGQPAPATAPTPASSPIPGPPAAPDGAAAAPRPQQ